MRFREKLESVRLVTILNYEDDDDDVEEKINNLNTIEDIKIEKEKLILQLKMLEKKAIEGQNVSRKLRILENKFEMIREMGELIALKHTMKDKTINEDKKIGSLNLLMFILLEKKLNFRMIQKMKTSNQKLMI